MIQGEFPKVRNYRSDLPTMPWCLSQSLWKLLFSVDFTLGLSDSEDAQGNVPPKTQQPGLIGNLYRRMYERIFAELKRRHAAYDFSNPLPLPEVSAEDFPKSEFRR